jgi:hypothetical protein
MDDDNKFLQVVEQKTVLFYNDELLAVRGDDNDVYVSLRHLCDALGLDFAGQSQRVQRNNVLSKGQRTSEIQTPRGRRQFVLIRVDLVPLWLAGVSTRSVRSDEARTRLETYQAEAAKVLWEAFQTGRLTQPDIIDLVESDTPAAQAYRMAAAIMKIAHQQLMLEEQLGEHKLQLSKHERRLEEIEAILGDPGRHITPDQAMQISQAVKAVATAIGKKSKRNEYGGVYGELYRRFGITAYKMLPAHKFTQAMEWLTDWYQSITGATGDDLPF